MKRFAVFACDRYYPAGGMSDFLKSFDKKEDAELYAEDHKASDERRDFYDVEDMSEYE